MPKVLKVLNRINYPAVGLVAAAALIWATDSVVRYPVSNQISTESVVFTENLLGLLVLLPIILFRYRKQVLPRTFTDALRLCLLGVVGSGLGDAMFGISIHELGPGTATLLQMLQPLVVLGFAAFFLKEKHTAIFVPCAIWVVFNAVVMSAPDLNWGFSAPLRANQVIGVASGLTAVLLWGFTTVLGKSLLKTYEPVVVVFWRWTGGLIFGAGYVAHQGKSVFSPLVFQSTEVSLLLLYLGTVAGVFAMTLYYKGLKQMPASIATFIELLYPLAGVFLPAIYFGASLKPIQFVSAVLLVGSIWILLKMEYQQRETDWSMAPKTDFPF